MKINKNISLLKSIDDNQHYSKNLFLHHCIKLLRDSLNSKLSLFKLKKELIDHLQVNREKRMEELKKQLQFNDDYLNRFELNGAIFQTRRSSKSSVNFQQLILR